MRQRMIGAVKIYQPAHMLVDAERFNNPEHDAMGAHFHNLADAAVKRGHSFFQHRSPGCQCCPVAYGKPVFHGGRAGKMAG